MSFPEPPLVKSFGELILSFPDPPNARLIAHSLDPSISSFPEPQTSKSPSQQALISSFPLPPYILPSLNSPVPLPAVMVSSSPPNINLKPNPPMSRIVSLPFPPWASSTPSSSSSPSPSISISSFPFPAQMLSLPVPSLISSLPSFPSM